MADHATCNLPSNDFDRTEGFYGGMGFTRRYRDEGWMILERGGMKLEFFKAPINPKESWFGACLRVDDLDGFHAVCRTLNLSENQHDIPRLGWPKREASGIRIFYMVDPDGTLLRCVENA